jgi:hypothetical protein
MNWIGFLGLKCLDVKCWLFFILQIHGLTAWGPALTFSHNDADGRTDYMIGIQPIQNGSDGFFLLGNTAPWGRWMNHSPRLYVFKSSNVVPDNKFTFADGFVYTLGSGALVSLPNGRALGAMLKNDEKTIRFLLVNETNPIISTTLTYPNKIFRTSIWTSDSFFMISSSSSTWIVGNFDTGMFYHSVAIGDNFITTGSTTSNSSFVVRSVSSDLIGGFFFASTSNFSSSSYFLGHVDANGRMDLWMKLEFGGVIHYFQNRIFIHNETHLFHFSSLNLPSIVTTTPLPTAALVDLHFATPIECASYLLMSFHISHAAGGWNTYEALYSVNNNTILQTYFHNPTTYTSSLEDPNGKNFMFVRTKPSNRIFDVGSFNVPFSDNRYFKFLNWTGTFQESMFDCPPLSPAFTLSAGGKGIGCVGIPLEL